jgi:predicted nicotinamide N-methyase
MVDDASSGAIVPYCAAPIGFVATRELKKMRERYFTIGPHFLRLEQHWDDDGHGGTQLGFGGTCYDAAFVLADFLHRAAVPLAGKSVVELGSGTGLVAIAATMLGARRVVATDGDAALVRGLVARNGERNCPAAWRAGRLTAATLLWGDAAMHAAVGASFDLVLAADVVAAPYEAALPQLLAALERLAPTAATTVLLAYQRRHKCEDAFFEAARRVFEITLALPDQLHPDFASQTGDSSKAAAISVLRMRRKT